MGERDFVLAGPLADEWYLCSTFGEVPLPYLVH
jgi:hypothetical protein